MDLIKIKNFYSVENSYENEKTNYIPKQNISKSHMTNLSPIYKQNKILKT